MEDDKFRLTVENYGKKISFEASRDLGAEDLMDIFFSAAVGLTFIPTTILTAMRDYAEMMLGTMDYNRE